MPGPGNKQKAPKTKTPAKPVPKSEPDSDLEFSDLTEIQELLKDLNPGILRCLSHDAYNAGYNAGCKDSSTYKDGWKKGYEDGMLDMECRGFRLRSTMETQTYPQAENKEMEHARALASILADVPTTTQTQDASLQVIPVTRNAMSQARPATSAIALQANPATRNAALQTTPAVCNATSKTTPAMCDATSQTPSTSHTTTVNLLQQAVVPTRPPGSAKTGETSSQTELHLYKAISQTNNALPPPLRSRSAPPSSCTSWVENSEPAPKTPDAQPPLPAPQPQILPTACNMVLRPTVFVQMAPATLPRVKPGIYNNMSPQTNVAPSSPPFDPDPLESHANWADEVELALKIPDAPGPTPTTTRDLSALCPSPGETTRTLRRHRMRRLRPCTGRTRHRFAQPTPPVLFEATDPALGPIFTRKHPAGIACGKPVIITLFGVPVPPPPHLMPPPSAPPLPRPTPSSPSPLLLHFTPPLSAPLPPHLVPPSPDSSPPPCPASSHSSGLDWESDPRLADLSNTLRALGWIRPLNDFPQG
ncbi:hypothetical protein BD779DRAFT_1684186 [Infundibulicybe gibba]|nr:hypothetical protein BD779DRAFT_1684186 [Infundibulicybe gibba]